MRLHWARSYVKRSSGATHDPVWLEAYSVPVVDMHNATRDSIVQRQSLSLLAWLRLLLHDG